MNDDVLILAIESSCDETAAAVVKNGREVLSNIINSQIDIHTNYGGVVPEIASRKHIENIDGVIELALKKAGVTLNDITAIAVTYGPGLVGALLVGVAEAKALAYATGKPLIGVHHIEGHISANYVENKELEPPFAALVVSGGHTHLVKVNDYGSYEIVGRGMMLPERHLTKWQEQWGLAILEVLKWISWLRRGIHMLLNFHGLMLRMLHMISHLAE